VFSCDRGPSPLRSHLSRQRWSCSSASWFHVEADRSSRLIAEHVFLRATPDKSPTCPTLLSFIPIAPDWPAKMSSNYSPAHRADILPVGCRHPYHHILTLTRPCRGSCRHAPPRSASLQVSTLHHNTQLVTNKLVGKTTFTNKKTVDKGFFRPTLSITVTPVGKGHCHPTVSRLCCCFPANIYYARPTMFSQPTFVPNQQSVGV
jgi:hypothetical protein